MAKVTFFREDDGKLMVAIPCDPNTVHVREASEIDKDTFSSEYSLFRGEKPEEVEESAEEEPVEEEAPVEEPKKKTKKKKAD